MEANLEKKDVNRKDFLSMAILAIGGVISFAIGIPAVAYILGPALRKATEQNWIPLGLASKVEVGVPTLFKAKIEQKAGWITNITAGILWPCRMCAPTSAAGCVGWRIRSSSSVPATTPPSTNRAMSYPALHRNLSTNSKLRSKMISYSF
jgi:hypothetical protein